MHHSTAHNSHINVSYSKTKLWKLFLELHEFVTNKKEIWLMHVITKTLEASLHMTAMNCYDA